jgi:cold shock CspA family protein
VKCCVRAQWEARLTGTIRTLRVDKGFGFIKDDTGKEYFFIGVRCMARDSTICVRGDSVEFHVGQGTKVPGPRMCGARPSDRRDQSS